MLRCSHQPGCANIAREQNLPYVRGPWHIDLVAKQLPRPDRSLIGRAGPERVGGRPFGLKVLMHPTSPLFDWVC